MNGSLRVKIKAILHLKCVFVLYAIQHITQKMKPYIYCPLRYVKVSLVLDSETTKEG